MKTPQDRTNEEMEMKVHLRETTQISKGIQMFLRGIIREMDFVIDFCSAHGFSAADLNVENTRSMHSAMDFLLWRNRECACGDELFLAGEKIASLLSGALFLHHRIPYDGIRILLSAFEVYAASFSHLFLLEVIRREIFIPPDECLVRTAAEEIYARVKGGVVRTVLAEDGNKMIKGFIALPDQDSPYVHSPHTTIQ